MIFRILVKGRVQGVNFREMVRRFCLGEGIFGSVRNCDDGSVEIHAQCGEGKKGKLVKWLKDSPGFSKVVDVEVEEVGSGEEFEGFEVIVEENFFKDQKKAMGNLGRKLFG